MTKTLTLKNDYHNTAVNLRVHHDGIIETMDIIHLTAGQVAKAKRTLCVAGCQCSGDLGTRADWHILGGLEVKLSIDTDSTDGKHITGARLAVEQIF